MPVLGAAILIGTSVNPFYLPPLPQDSEIKKLSQNIHKHSEICKFSFYGALSLYFSAILEEHLGCTLCWCLF